MRGLAYISLDVQKGLLSLLPGVHGNKRTVATRGAKTKLQALVYDILPRATAIVYYALGLGKLPAANKQLFDDAQMAVNLQQTIQIISDVSFITDHVAYDSTNKNQEFQSRRNLSSSLF